MAEQSVTLNPGESKVVTFEAVAHEAKVYQVTVNGLSGSFVATSPPVASLSGYVTEAGEAIAGAEVTVVEHTGFMEANVYRIYSGANGFYSMENMVFENRPIVVDISVEAVGYTMIKLVDAILAEGDNTLNFEMTAPPPVPEVVLSNLVIEPSEVMVGERVYIRVTGTNYSDAYYKAKTVVFKIDGVVVKALTYNLAPGRSMEYVYSFIPFEAGTYTVEADGLYGSLVVIEMPPTDIELSNLIIIPTNPIAYERIYFKVTATNYGDVKETRQILCRFNGRTVMPQTVTLSPGESKVVTFSVMLFGPGTFTVVIDGLTGTFEVI